MNIQNISFHNNLRLEKPVFAIFINLLFVLTLFAQGSPVDLTFNAAVTSDVDVNNATVNAGIALQPDGKILVFGNFNNVGGVPKNKIARLNADGTLDNSFTCDCGNFTSIGSAVVQPDGKIIIAGYFGPAPNARIARLNSDGSVDYSLTSPFNQGFGGAKVWALAADGKIYVSQSFAGFHISYLAFSRLNSDGSFDNSFAQIGFDNWGWKDALYAVKLLPDGKLMMSGKQQANNFGHIFRVNTNGTKDNTFESPALANGNQQFPWSYIFDFGIQSTGKVVIVGNFTSVNGVARAGSARLNTDSSVDMSFTATFSGLNLEIVSGDKILVDAYRRYNADGTLDNTFNPAYTSIINPQLDSMERIVFGTEVMEGSTLTRKIARMNSDGSADNTFTNIYLGFTGEIYKLAAQPDGKILILGLFHRVNGTLAPINFARVDSSGNLDPSFVPATDLIPYSVSVIKVQPDGKILLGGGFTSYNGIPRQGIARINSNGSLDATFNPVLSANGRVDAIVFQNDGKILIGGVFTEVNGSSRTSIARLNSDGTLDASFNPTLGSPTINSLFVQSNGQIMVAGGFSGVNGFNRTNLARLNADGSLDTAFNAGSIGAIRQVGQQSNGKYLIITNAPQNGGLSIAWRNTDGTADDSFPMPRIVNGGNPGFIDQFILQPDGNIVVTGGFTSIGNTPRNHIARLRPDAIVDSFMSVGTSSQVNAAVVQPDGKYVIGGAFSSVENIPRNAIARIASTATQPRMLFDYDGDGKADVSVFRPSENKWYVLRSSDLTVQQFVFAIAGDFPVPADYDGDGKTDFAIFRPSSGDWWSLSSQTGGQVYAHWGANGDIPRPSDFDGDGRADYVVYRPSNNTWYRISSANGAGSNPVFGLAGDKPVRGDFDGDGKSDVAIFRPSNGDWWYQSSINGAQLAVHWGISTDIPAPADFDGDGKTDFAVYRPSTGTWYIINSSNFSFTIMNFGISEDKPVPADYDGDGKADIAVFRPSTGAWYLQRTTAGFWGLSFGISTDIPTENAFIQ